MQPLLRGQSAGANGPTVGMNNHRPIIIEIMPESIALLIFRGLLKPLPGAHRPSADTILPNPPGLCDGRPIPTSPNCTPVAAPPR